MALRASRLDNTVQITVTDTGAGIPAEEQPFIFERFWRGDVSRSHAEGAGAGLGLAIAKQLVAAHGGTIAASDRATGDTCFTISIPALAAPQDSCPRRGGQSLSELPPSNRLARAATAVPPFLKRISELLDDYTLCAIISTSNSLTLNKFGLS